MAERQICSIPNCGKPIKNSRGWCSQHYQRWLRNGDPLRIRQKTEKGAAVQFLDEIVLSYKGNDCLIWPFSKSKKGYGRIGNKIGKRADLHNVICRLTHGEPPSPRHEAAHDCGVRSCCNPNHIRWKTHKENCHDTFRHGTVLLGECRPSAKLTESDVRQIRSLERSLSRKEIRDLYGISQTQLHNILHRKKWSWLA